MAIHIKPSKKGTLHDALGISRDKKIPTSKLAIHEGDSSALKKKKQFAQNAKKWKHAEGGEVIPIKRNDKQIKAAYGGPIPVNPFPNGFKIPQEGIQSIPVTPDPYMWNTNPASLGDPNVTAPVDPNRIKPIENANYQPNTPPPGGYLNNGMVPVTSNKLSMPRALEESVATPPNMTTQNKPKKQKDFGNALGGKTGFDSIPGQIAGATLQVLNNVIQEKDKPKNLYLRPEDLPTYNPHPYGVLNSQGQGSQAISKNGKNVKGKKLFWGALIGAVGGGGAASLGAGATSVGTSAASLGAGATSVGGTAASLGSGTLAGGAATAGGGTSTAALAGNAAQIEPAAKGIKGHWEKPFKQTADAVKGGLQDSIAFTKMIADMRETGIDPANIQQPNYQRINQIQNEGLNRMYKPAMAKGGNIRANNGSGLMTYGGGSAPKESSNMFDGGTHMFTGDSHAEGGIPASFNGTGFEAEGGEPFSVIGNKGVVFGKLKNPLTGRSYKKDAKEIMKKEQKVDEYLMQGIDLVHNKDPYNKFERLGFNSGIVMMKGAAEKQKQLADSKKHLADMQKAHLDLIGEESEVAEYGKIIADKGTPPLEPYKGDKNNKSNKSKYSKEEWNQFAKDIGYTGNINDNKAFQRWVWNSKYGQIAKDLHTQYGMPNGGKYDDGLLGHRWDVIKETIQNVPTGQRMPFPIADKYMPQGPKKATIDSISPKTPEQFQPYPFQQVEDYPMSKLNNKLSPLQFLGEGNALLDQPDAVKAQLYQPDLYTPYQVSFQDRINEQNSTFNALQKAVAYDPTALSVLAAQKYGANDSVKAEEFRVNQGIANDIMNKNNSLLNDAKLKNLSIIDNQYVRQETAKSITKQNKQNALSSISAKVLQNQADTSSYNTYRNLFPHYGFDKNYKTVKEGAPGGDYLSFDGAISATGGNDRTVTSYDAVGKKKSSRVTTLSPTEQALENAKLQDINRKLGNLPPLFPKKGNGAIIKRYKES